MSSTVRTRWLACAIRIIYDARMPPTLGIIGGGNMGSAIVRGAIERGVLAADHVLVVEIDRSRRETIGRLGCHVTDELSAIVNCEQLLLAVKPQAFADVASAMPPLPQSKVVISIMAGKSSASIRQRLSANARIVRAMPNTPCQIGEGMTAIALGAGASEGDERLAQSLFASLGKCIMVDEHLMDAVTAVSGSGPAYVFLLAEAMEQAAMKVGLSLSDARVLASQTVFGAAKLLAQSERTADELRQAVTSPGGTTAAALELMFERELPEIVSQAITAARDRGRELAE